MNKAWVVELKIGDQWCPIKIEWSRAVARNILSWSKRRTLNQHRIRRWVREESK